MVILFDYTVKLILQSTVNLTSKTVDANQDLGCNLLNISRFLSQNVRRNIRKQAPYQFTDSVITS